MAFCVMTYSFSPKAKQTLRPVVCAADSDKMTCNASSEGTNTPHWTNCRNIFRVRHFQPNIVNC